jgi:heme exporter protein B
MKFWAKVFAIARKDTLSEMRSREIISSVLMFALLVIVIYEFAFGSNPDNIKIIAPGMLWTTFVFAGMLSLNRAFIPEKEQGCMEGLMICPVSRDAIYAGKAISSLLFMLIVEAVALIVFAILFNLPVISLPVITITVLTTIGFVSVGTLFSALSVNTKAREMVLPILFLPIVIPIIIAAVNATQGALVSGSFDGIGSWLQIIVAFDVIFSVVSFLTFDFIVVE